MIKHVFLLTTLILLGLMCSCSHNVSINFVRNSQRIQDAQVGIGEAEHNAKWEKYHYDNDTVVYNGKVPSGNNLFYYGELLNEGKTQTNTIVVNNDIINEKKEINIDFIEADPSSIKKLISGIRDSINENPKLFYPTNINAINACSSVLGGFRLLDKFNRIVDIIYPQTLGYVYDKYNWGTYCFNKSIVVGKDLESELTVNLPAIVDFKASFQNSEFTKFHFVIDSAGWFEWVPPFRKNQGNLLFELDSVTLNTLISLYEMDTTQSLIFYYKAYVVKSMIVEYAALSRLTGSIDGSYKIYGGLKGNYIDTSKSLTKESWNDIFAKIEAYDATGYLKLLLEERNIKKLSDSLKIKTAEEKNENGFDEYKIVIGGRKPASLSEDMRSFQAQISDYNDQLHEVGEISPSKFQIPAQEAFGKVGDKLNLIEVK